MDSEDIGKIHKWLAGRKNMLVYCGNPGSGKTYLSAAMTNYCCTKFDSFRIFSEKRFLERLHAVVGENFDTNRALIDLTDAEFFIYDDLGSSGFTDWRRGVLFEMIDLRYGSQLPTIITTNLTRAELSEMLEPRTVSRLFAKENTIIENYGEDKRQKEAQ